MKSSARNLSGSRRTGHRRTLTGGWRGRLVATLTDARGRFVALGLFLALVCFTGGGSRADIVSLIVLRPATILIAGYALMLATADDLRRVRGPLAILTALLALAALQLIPLPYAAWSSLPLRDEIAEFGRLAGIDRTARPLSLDPNRTWNTLFALFAPLAAVLLVAIQREAYRQRVIPALLTVAMASIAFAVFQTLGVGAFYLYEITNTGYPVGLFSNRNHQAILLCWFLLAATWHATGGPHAWRARTVLAALAAMLLVSVPLILLTGSRAGLAFSLPTLAVASWIVWQWLQHSRKAAAGRRLRLGLLFGTAVLIGGIALLLLTLASSTRVTALSRLFQSDSITELRWIYLPIYLDMVRDFLPLGSGFGSFENVFNAYEPASLLSRRYMNQAHNDLFQLVIEGGIPALLILAAALAWLVRAGVRAFRRHHGQARVMTVFLLGSLGIWLGASLFDYPLRTPLGAVLFGCLTALLSLHSKAQAKPTSDRARNGRSTRESGRHNDPSGNLA